MQEDNPETNDDVIIESALSWIVRSLEQTAKKVIVDCLKARALVHSSRRKCTRINVDEEGKRSCLGCCMDRSFDPITALDLRRVVLDFRMVAVDDVLGLSLDAHVYAFIWTHMVSD